MVFFTQLTEKSSQNIIDDVLEERQDMIGSMREVLMIGNGKLKRESLILDLREGDQKIVRLVGNGREERQVNLGFFMNSFVLDFNIYLDLMSLVHKIVRESSSSKIQINQNYLSQHHIHSCLQTLKSLAQQVGLQNWIHMRDLKLVDGYLNGFCELYSHFPSDSNSFSPKLLPSFNLVKNIFLSSSQTNRSATSKQQQEEDEILDIVDIYLKFYLGSKMFIDPCSHLILLGGM